MKSTSFSSSVADAGEPLLLEGQSLTFEHVAALAGESATQPSAPVRESSSRLKPKGASSWVASSAVNAGQAESVFSGAVDDVDASKEQLQHIKARTMHNMTEEILDPITGTRKRLLFLTNAQAEIISDSNASLQKMLDALEITKPKLIINLLMSQAYTYGAYPPDFSGDPDFCGRTTEDPFLSAQDKRAAQEGLDSFMAHVLLPLASQTNALIMCSAHQGCIASMSLMRMITVHRASWGKDMPFSILGVYGNMQFLYQNPDPNAAWRGIRRASNQWRQRDRKLLDLVFGAFAGDPPPKNEDLNPNVPMYLIVDSIDAKRDKIMDRRPFNHLTNELLRYLASSLPCLTIKTGNSDKTDFAEGLQRMSSLAIAMDAMLSGSPLLFLDMREHPPVKAKSRQEYIANAKEYYETWCQQLLDAGMAETMDAWSIAYFHEVLFGVGNSKQSDDDTALSDALKDALPLHEAVKLSQTGLRSETDSSMKPATEREVQEVASWLANKFFEDGWKLLPESQKKNKTFESFYGDRPSTLTTQIKVMLTHRNFHSLNLSDPEVGAAKRLVNNLVKLDRLPTETNAQGLLLLRSAWCEHDVMMYLSDWYKSVSKTVFALQLLLAWCIIALAALRDAAECKEGSLWEWLSFLKTGGPEVDHILFGLTTLVSVTTAIDNFLNPLQRWRQLRSSASSLRASIWLYRARVDVFKQSISDRASPEKAFLEAMRAWRDELTSGADLLTTDLERKRPDHVYKHLQYQGDKEELLAMQSGQDSDRRIINDFHSPVRPEDYIVLRLEKMMEFYQGRLPLYSRDRNLLRALITLCTTGSIFLVYWGLSPIVVVLTALSGMIVSWSEYTDKVRKIERYSRAVQGFKNLHMWWDALSDVEQAGTENISFLIMSSEEIIADERLAWRSTAYRLAGSRSKAEGEEQQRKQQEQNGAFEITI